MSLEENTPKIRFKGFTDPWEQRKLEDITNVVGGGTPSSVNTDYWNGDINWFTPTEIGSNKYLLNSQKKISSLGLKSSSAKILPTGTILFTSRASIGDVAITTGEVTTNQGFQSLVPKNNISSEFIYYIAQNIKNKALKLASGSTFKEISSKSVKNILLFIPIRDLEQQSLGTLFKNLDTLIAANQKQLEQLKETKKLLMQKIFSQEWRFKGYTDPWEQRKLGEMVDFTVSTNSLSRSQLNYNGGKINNIHYGDILVNYGIILEVKKDIIPFITNGSLNKYESNLLKNGDIVFADAAEDDTVGKAIEIDGISDGYFVVSGLHTIVARTNKKMAKYFLGYYINSDFFHRQLLRLMQGSKVSSISKSNLKKTYVQYSQNYHEQQKIGTLFKNLDTLIAANQRTKILCKKHQKYIRKNLYCDVSRR